MRFKNLQVFNTGIKKRIRSIVMAGSPAFEKKEFVTNSRNQDSGPYWLLAVHPLEWA